MEKKKSCFHFFFTLPQKSELDSKHDKYECLFHNIYLFDTPIIDTAECIKRILPQILSSLI